MSLSTFADKPTAGVSSSFKISWSHRTDTSHVQSRRVLSLRLYRPYLNNIGSCQHLAGAFAFEPLLVTPRSPTRPANGDGGGSAVRVGSGVAVQPMHHVSGAVHARWVTHAACWIRSIYYDLYVSLSCAHRSHRLQGVDASAQRQCLQASGKTFASPHSPLWAIFIVLSLSPRHSRTARSQSKRPPTIWGRRFI